MKKNIWAAVLILFGAVGTAFYVSEKRLDIAKDNTPKTVHVYLDVATTSAFQQMLRIISMSDYDEKIVLWNRNQEYIPQDMVEKYNLHFMSPTLWEKVSFYLERFQKYVDNLLSPYPSREAIAYYEANLPLKLAKRINKYIQIYMQRNPNARFAFHVNYMHAKRILVPALLNLPKDKIEEIYFYEDGPAWLAGLYLNDSINEKIMELVKVISKKYPVTFELTFPDVEKNGVTLARFFAENYQFKIHPVDYKVYSKTLNDNQKNDLLNFFNVSYEELSNLLSKPNTVLLLSAPFFFIQGYEFDMFEAIGDDIKVDNVVLKPHPVKEDTPYILRKIHEKYPNTQIMPKQLPFEMLVILDLMPEYVIGITTSCFFSAPTENIYKYISYQPDFYKDILLKLGILSPEKIIDISTLREKGEI